jgi:NADP-dependent 3-hydroxy acid dehydrogenase YdfG
MTGGKSVVCVYVDVHLMKNPILCVNHFFMMITASVWFLKGMMEYTRRGYETASKRTSSDSSFHESLQQLSQSVFARNSARKTPLVAIVTGANSGLGYETTYWLAKSGVSTYMVCRNPERASKARESIMQRIQQESAGALNRNTIANDSDNSDSTHDQEIAGQQPVPHIPAIDIRIINVSKPRELKSLVQEWTDAQRPLHILVNNAGALSTAKEAIETEDGLDESFATNSLSTYLLTEWFWPILEQTARNEATASSLQGDCKCIIYFARIALGC